MPKIYVFKSTQCYTRGNAANTVSMDYFFIEVDEKNEPISQDLFIETWDMPLPTPEIEAKLNNDKVIIRIKKDAFFNLGKTTFAINNPRVEIKNVKFKTDREVVITIDNPKILIGSRISFEMKNLFYHHFGETLIE